VDCGAKTRFGAERARVPEPRCDPCARAYRKIWTPEAIVCAVQEWNAVYGEPPAIADWNPWCARHDYHDEARARRFETDACWPIFSVVIREFGNWNTAIIAAGFEPRAGHGGAGNHFRQRRFAL
jgi:hypothetical protein